MVYAASGSQGRAVNIFSEMIGISFVMLSLWFECTTWLFLLLLCYVLVFFSLGIRL
jgi:hypothetical protein